MCTCFMFSLFLNIQVIDGTKLNVEIILDDPTGNSYIQVCVLYKNDLICASDAIPPYSTLRVFMLQSQTQK